MTDSREPRGDVGIDGPARGVVVLEDRRAELPARHPLSWAVWIRQMVVAAARFVHALLTSPP